MSPTDDTRVDEGKAPEVEDLALIDDALEDEGKDDAEIWGDIEQAEAAAESGAAADDSAAASDAAAAAAATTAADDAGTTGGEELPPADKPAAAEQDDPWAAAPEELRSAHDADQARIKKLEQSDRSQRGRLGSMQRQINELHGTRAQPAADETAAGDAAGATGGGKDFLASDDWKSFESEYPEVATPMKQVVSDLRNEVTRQGSALDAITTDRHHDAADEQEHLLEEEHADWEEVTAAEEFGTWLDEQPRHIKEAAIRNAEEIVDAEEAADVVGRFKATRSAQAGDGPATDTPDAGDEADAGDGPTPLTGKRQRQLEAASTTRTGGPGVATGIPEDGDEAALWKAMDKEDARREAQRA